MLHVVLPLVVVVVAAAVVIGMADGQETPFRELAPPSVHTGSVFHGIVSDGSAYDPDYRDFAMQQFSAMTATVYLPWYDPNNAPDTSGLTRMVDRLRPNQMLVHGHSLLYPLWNSFVDWWANQPNNQVELRLNQFIESIAGVRRGQVWTWDVVNEVMWDHWHESSNSRDADGVRTHWKDGSPVKEYAAMGQDYIRKAFFKAREVDPDALLLITDYVCEEDHLDNDNEKSDNLYRFVRKLRSEGVPVDGVGFQGHMWSYAYDGLPPDHEAMRRNFKRFRELGVKIFITELDVPSITQVYDPNSAPQDALARAANGQAEVFRQVFRVCLDEPVCEACLFWDYADQNSRRPDLTLSWLHPYEETGEYTFPTPIWDIRSDNLRLKPAWYAMRNEMSRCTLTYRMTSLWDFPSGYLARTSTLNSRGEHEPAFDLALFDLHVEWHSMQWILEKVVYPNWGASVPDLYRIRCYWGSEDGYLSRHGIQDANTFDWYPAANVYVTSLHPEWTSQMWHINYADRDVYKVWNHWSNGHDHLTRLGELVPGTSDRYSPTSSVNLIADQDYESQNWKFSMSNEGCVSPREVALFQIQTLNKDFVQGEASSRVPLTVATKMTRHCKKASKKLKKNLAATSIRKSLVKCVKAIEGKMSTGEVDESIGADWDAEDQIPFTSRTFNSRLLDSPRRQATNPSDVL